MTFLFDENFPKAARVLLEELGHEVLDFRTLGEESQAQSRCELIDFFDSIPYPAIEAVPPDQAAMAGTLNEIPKVTANSSV